ncbi:hypothetical protein GQ44DRAFT_823659 [Phaeosphaeriaceae sp. PMI808]|nr:hypothetical protein GQ44DRAFT_823659 [Phaeosphaeriaceae sp. PMI808]
MGRVAVVGGSSNVARDVIDAIIKNGNHEVTICSRKLESPADLPSTVKWVTVDYNDHSSLVSAFSGINTVLSFVVTNGAGASFQAEKQIIDAAIAAGVSRIAPSQWSAIAEAIVK